MITHSVSGTARADRARLLGAMARADAEDTPLELDLAPLDAGNASKRRLNGWWVATVSNLLLGRYSDLRVVVRHPQAPSIQRQLLRNGLFFALAQRPGEVRHHRLTAVVDDMLERASGEWAPRHGPELFPEAQADRQSERTFLYANTHARAESGYFRRYQASAAFPWLGEVVPRPHGNLGGSVHDLFVSATAETMGEVLDNISTHAFNLRDAQFAAGWLGPTVVDRSRSCFLISVTEGGRGSYDRLHVLALDNGFSIPRTLRWQHPSPLRHNDAADLMVRVLQRRLVDRDIEGHNGAGLWFLYGLARFAGGQITLITENDHSDGRSASRVDVAVSPADVDEPSSWSVSTVPAPVRGTIVHLQMRIPSLVHADPEQLQQQYEDFHRYRASWRVSV